MTSGVEWDTLTFTYRDDNDTGVSEPKTITITVTGSNDASGKDATETTENTRYWTATMPAATDVDGTVSYQLVDDVTEGSLTFNDDGSYTFTPGSDFDDAVGQR